jgi:hypothetical protein
MGSLPVKRKDLRGDRIDDTGLVLIVSPRPGETRAEAGWICRGEVRREPCPWLLWVGTLFSKCSPKSALVDDFCCFPACGSIGWRDDVIVRCRLRSGRKLLLRICRPNSGADSVLFSDGKCSARNLLFRVGRSTLVVCVTFDC